jgi:hypothetical protein
MTTNKPANASDYVVEDTFDIDARPGTSVGAVSSGWGDTAAAPKGDYPIDFKQSEQIQIIKFIDEGGPFASYKMHFLTKKTSGRRSYVCLGAKCPLCEMDPTTGGRPEDKRAFTVVNLSVDPFERQLLVATPKLFRQLHQLDFSQQGPLTSKYWGINRTGERQTTNYHLTPIKARDLQEDWGIDGDAAEAFAAQTVAFEASVIRENAYAELVEIANSLS